MKGSGAAPTDPECCHHPHTGASAHDGLVVQRAADGSMAIIGHHQEEGKLCASKTHNEKNLCGTSHEGDGVAAGWRIQEGFGFSDRDIADVNQGQILQEEVHGGSETLVHGGEGDNEEVPRQGCQVNEEEECGTQALEPLGIRESREQEFCYVVPGAQCLSHADTYL